MSDPELRARILAAVRCEPRPPTRADVLQRKAGVAATSLLGAAALFLLAASAPERSGDGTMGNSPPTAVLMATTTATVALAFFGLVYAYRRARSLCAPVAQVLALIGATTPLALFAGQVARGLHLHGEPGWGRGGFRSFSLACVVALVLLGGLVATRARSDPAHPYATGAALGVSAGAIAALLIDQWCPIRDVHHYLLSHVTPLAVFAILGWGSGLAIEVPGTQKISSRAAQPRASSNVKAVGEFPR